MISLWLSCHEKFLILRDVKFFNYFLTKDINCFGEILSMQVPVVYCWLRAITDCTTCISLHFTTEEKWHVLKNRALAHKPNRNNPDYFRCSLAIFECSK